MKLTAMFQCAVLVTAMAVGMACSPPRTAAPVSPPDTGGSGRESGAGGAGATAGSPGTGGGRGGADAGGPAASDAGLPTEPDAGLADTSVPGPDAGSGKTPDVAPAAVCGSGANRLGPPTAAELKAIDDRIKAAPYTPAGTNQGNNFAYGTAAKLAGQMRAMFALTGDVFYLDQMVKFADHMLAARNDPQTGRMIWTGRREPCWPNKAETAGDAAYCGAENGLVVGQIVGTAKVIFQNPALWKRTVGIPDPNHYGATYLDRARTYLREGRRTVDEFLVPNYVQPSDGNRIHIPTNPGFAALPGNYAKDQGHALPWNQQDMVVNALTVVSDSLLALGEEPDVVSRNDQIAKAALDWFVSELQRPEASYQVNGVPVYKWGYAPGNFKNIENLAHASADINMLYNGYRRGRAGIQRSVLVPMANTFLDVIAKPDGTYASEVDGSGTRASVSGSWMNYEEFRAGIVARLSPKLTVETSTSVEEAISILSLRKRLCP